MKKKEKNINQFKKQNKHSTWILREKRKEVFFKWVDKNSVPKNVRFIHPNMVTQTWSPKQGDWSKSVCIQAWIHHQPYWQSPPTLYLFSVLIMNATFNSIHESNVHTHIWKQVQQQSKLWPKWIPCFTLPIENAFAFY